MNNYEGLTRERLAKIADGLLALIVLALSVEMYKAWHDESEQLMLISRLFFLSSTLYRFIGAFVLRKNSRLEFIHDITSGCLLLAGFVVLLFSESGNGGLVPVGIFFLLSVLTDRIFSVIKNHKLPNIVLNIAIVAVVVALGNSVLAIVMVSIVQAMKNIMGIAYSQMKMDIFWKVVRKTNAAEILFGMLLLIIAFSLVLPILEENIPDFFSALWYSFAIISTIGFGDVAATSILGRVLSAIMGLCGLVVVSVVMSIVVNFYNETKNMDD